MLRLSEGSDTDQAGEQTFRSFVLVGAMLLFPWSVLWGLFGVEPLAFLLLGAGVVLLLTLRYRGALGRELASHLALATVVTVILTTVCVTGGMFRNTSVWILPLPVAAALLLDVRGSAAWGVAILLSTGVLWGLDLSGFPFPDLLQAADRPVLRAASHVSALVAVLLVSLVHAQLHRAALVRASTSARNLSRLLQAIPEPIYSVQVEEGGELRCELMNAAMVDLLGVDLTGVRFHEMIEPADERMRSVVDDAIRGLRVVMESRSAHQSGAWVELPKGRRLLEVRSQPLFDARGEVHQIISVARDLTDAVHLAGALEERAKRLEVLNDVARVLASEHSAEELYEVLYRQVGRVLKRDVFFVALWDEERSVFSLPLVYDGGVPYPGRELSPGDGPTGRALRERRTVTWSQAESALPSTPSVGDPARRAVASVHAPMIKDGRVLGVLSVQSYGGEYSEEDVRLFEALADQAAVALENVRLYQQVRGSESRFRDLLGAIERMEGHNVMVTDLEGTITYAAGTKGTHGYLAEELIGRGADVLGRRFPGWRGPGPPPGRPWRVAPSRRW